LAIDPGTREMGIAFLEDRNLLEYGVKNFRDARSHRELLVPLDALFSRLLSEKQPDVVIIEKNQFSQIKANLLLALAIARIRSLVRKKRISLREYGPRTVRKAVCANGNATKAELARTVAAAYPELRAYLEADRKWKLRYWQNIFDAVALGMAYLKLGQG
jgi:crossover junction endodeoxyribonuclease RuvC